MPNTFRAPSRAVAASLMTYAFLVACCGAAESSPTRESDAPQEVLRWIRDHAAPFKTVEAGNGFADLEPLRQMIGDARIVALGEATHGSREIFQLKHRLVEFLASEMGFTMLAIEANMPEARRVNDYVTTGRGDPRALIHGMYFWTLRTQEMLATIEWMRRFNAQPATSNQPRLLEFTGFDMQYPDLALPVVRDYAALRRPDLLPKIDEATKALEGAKLRDPVGTAMGDFPLDTVRGRRVTFSGWIKTKDVTDGYAGLIWRADTAEKPSAVLNNMYRTGPRGTTDWTRYEMTVDVPEAATSIGFGMLLSGEGTAWFDDLEVKIDGKPYDPGKEFDFTFEQDHLAGLFTTDSSYKVRPVPEPHGGKQSLRFDSLDLGEDTSRRATALWTEIRAQLALEKDRAGDGKTASWAARCARIVQQTVEFNSRPRAQRSSFRDACMAENVQWLLDDNPGAKLILWAHNGHVRRSAEAMGGFLARGREKMVVIGFATGKGSYRAWTGQPTAEFPLQSPSADSIEAALVATGSPRLLLDLRTTRAGAVMEWFNEARPHRLIGGAEVKNQFELRRPVARDYDILVWIEETSSSITLPR